MVVQPSIEEHEDDVLFGKFLEEELNAYECQIYRICMSCNLKREIVKRVATRGPISTTKRPPCANTKYLGQEVETDDGLEWRVKWSQRWGDRLFCLG